MHEPAKLHCKRRRGRDWLTPERRSQRGSSPVLVTINISPPVISRRACGSPSTSIPSGNVGRPSATNSAKTRRSEEHTSELQSLMRISYAVFCLKKITTTHIKHENTLHRIHKINGHTLYK